MRTGKILVLFIFYVLLVPSCEYEALHELIPIKFETEVDCYWTTFTPTSDLAGDYLWNFGDGDTSSEKNPRHIYEQAGQYEVTLNLTNGEGAGEFSKTVIISPSSTNTFRRDNDSRGSYQEYINANLLGGYDLLIRNFSNKLTSVHEYSADGIFQSTILEGSIGKDYVAYHRVQGANMVATNNLEKGCVELQVTIALEGVYSFALDKKGAYLSAKKVVYDEGDRNAFVLAIYGEDKDSKEGLSLYSPWYRGFFDIPFDQTNFTNVFFDLTLTPNKEIMLAYSINGKGVRVLQLNKALEKIWEANLPDLSFDIGDNRFNIIDSQDPISIVALSEEAYILTVADSDRYLHSDPGIFDANPKVSIIKGDKDHIDWSITKDRLVSAKAVAIAQNKDIIICSSLATDRQQHTSTYLLRLEPTGDIIFEKEVFPEEFDIFPKEILETPGGNFFIVGRSLDFLQVDCGGNFQE